jgi:hypothetical protein
MKEFNLELFLVVIFGYLIALQRPWSLSEMPPRFYSLNVTSITISNQLNSAVTLEKIKKEAGILLQIVCDSQNFLCQHFHLSTKN